MTGRRTEPRPASARSSPWGPLTLGELATAEGGPLGDDDRNRQRPRARRFVRARTGAQRSPTRHGPAASCSTGPGAPPDRPRRRADDLWTTNSSVSARRARPAVFPQPTREAALPRARRRDASFGPAACSSAARLRPVQRRRPRPRQRQVVVEHHGTVGRPAPRCREQPVRPRSPLPRRDQGSTNMPRACGSAPGASIASRELHRLVVHAGSSAAFACRPMTVAR